MKLLIFLRFAIFFVCLSCLFTFIESSRVLELTDRFIELKKEGMWFVMLYAPWCAHCKRLEPIWNHVAQALYRTNIRVGRIDCTRFTSVASSFSINGFPTIIFVKDDTQYVFKADRTKEEMLNFAIRLSGPPVQRITRSESLKHLKSTNDIFFLYMGDFDGHLWDVFLDVAERHHANSFFYCTEHNLVRNQVTVEKVPSVIVFKEDVHYPFEDEDSPNLNHSLSKWVNEERFLTFPKVTKGNLHQFFQIEKYIALAVLEENKLQEMSTEMLEFRDMVLGVVQKHRSRFHRHFQFGWVGSPELANSIAMTVLPLPHLIVVNTTTQQHHLPDDDPSQLTPEALIEFLDQVHNRLVPTLGGTSWWVRLYRTYFEAKTTLTDMWYGNPVLTAVLFGLPLGFLSLICYSICCADIMDAEEEDEEELLHEKKE